MTIKNNAYFKVLVFIFGLCLIFALTFDIFMGVKLKATTNEILKNDTTEEVIEEENQEEITEENVNELVDEFSLEVKDFVLWVVGILSALGISWGSIATVIKWIKEKVKSANQDLATTFEKLEETKKELKENNVTLDKVKQELNNVKEQLGNLHLLLNDFYDATKLKQLAIEKAVNKALIEEKKEDDLKDESI